MKHKAVGMWAVLVFACSSGHRSDPAVPPASAPRGSGAGVGSALAKSETITPSECEAMIGHILDVQLAEKRQTVPADQVPTPEQVETIRKKMLSDERGVRGCAAFDRVSMTCVMKATDTAALEACARPVE